MGETRAELKTRLTSEGRWSSYIEKRDALVATHGMSTKEASVLLTREFGVGATCIVNVETGQPEATAGIDIAPASDLAPTPTTPDVVPPQPHAPKPTIAARPAVTHKSFEGRTCSESEAIRWCFENLAIEDLKPEDAPSSGAWGLLQECQRSPSFREDFLKTILPKLLPTRQQIETQESFNDDGRDVLDLINKLQASMVAEAPYTNSENRLLGSSVINGN